jgi:hypothetical protein
VRGGLINEMAGRDGEGDRVIIAVVVVIVMGGG